MSSSADPSFAVEPDKRHRLVLILAAALVVGFYWLRVTSYVSELGNTDAAGAYYNRLIDGFSAGQLNLKVEVPPGLAQLRDPYDPEANDPFRGAMFEPGRLHDASFYRGKIYLYQGITPALLLFWPYHLLTGGYFPQHYAVALFCTLGFLAQLALLRAILQRHFPTTNVATLAGCALVLGFANSVPAMLRRPDVWEVPIACGYALTALALLALWRAIDDAGRRDRWLALASAAYGLAVGARPTLLFGAPILLLPLLPGFGQPFKKNALASANYRGLLAALAPIAAIGFGLACYNYARFGSIAEFGQTYQLAGDRQDQVEHFSWRYLWFNARLYFWQIATWSPHLPLTPEIAIPPMPDGHGAVDRPHGALVNTPILLAAFALPFLWQRFHAAVHTSLRRIVVAIGFVFFAAAGALCLFYGTCIRYQVEFQPALALLAAIGICALRTHLASRPARTTVPGLWIVLLVFSVVFSVRRDREYPARLLYIHGTTFQSHGQPAAAIPYYEKALAIDPRMIEVLDRLGIAYYELHRPAEAATYLETALSIQPDYFQLHLDYGGVLWDLRRPQDALRHLERAVVLRPDSFESHYAFSMALRGVGRLDEARVHYDAAKRLRPEMLPAAP